MSRDLVKNMITLSGSSLKSESNIDGEIEIQFTGLQPGEKLYEELLNDTSKTLPTHHEKIMIAQEMFDDYTDLEYMIVGLINSAATYSDEEVVARMKEIIPEFISMNSSFQSLDQSSNR